MLEVYAMKVQVNLNEDIVKKIDQYAKSIGVSRSAVCALWIGQAVLGVDKAAEILQNVGSDVAKTIAHADESKAEE